MALAIRESNGTLAAELQTEIELYQKNTAFRTTNN